MQIINLQPHSVVLPGGIELKPSGRVARVSESLEPTAHPLEGLGLPVLKQQLGQVTVGDEPLPASQDGTYYVVSLYVQQALPERSDLLVPVGQIRDEQGRIIGCQGLAVSQ